METQPLISVVIVSYNTRDMTAECLRTLDRGLQGIPSEIIVVDNGSADGSVEAIRADFPAVRVIANPDNTGFGAANNLGMQAARGDFFLLLNSDAFPEPEAAATMLAYLRENPRAGVVGPRTLNKDGSLQISCYKFPSPAHAWQENLWLSRGYSDWAHDTEREVEFIIGACMLVRREVFAEVGGFDEKFFMYSEETDWQRRIWDAGWKIVFLPNARVTHLGGASGGTQSAKVRRYFFDSLDYYSRKHHGFGGLLAVRGAMVVGCFLRAILWSAASVLPSRRELAASKVRLHSWLVLRQAFHWR
jgi:GT2 family glycosyltransferase